jgi:hypothetical protein
MPADSPPRIRGGPHVVLRGGRSSRTEHDYGIETQDRGAQESSPNLGFDKGSVS